MRDSLLIQTSNMSLPRTVSFSTPPLVSSPSSYNFPPLRAPSYQYIPVSPRLTTNQLRPPQTTVPPEHLHIPRPPTPPRRPTYSSSSSTLSESESLGVEVLYIERRHILEWLLASVPSHRSAYALSTLHIDTLRWGLEYLRSRISALVAQDIVLYRHYRSLLGNENATERGFAYAGWSWSPPPDEVVYSLDRADVLRFLFVDVGVYDEVNKSVRGWRKSIERRRNEIEGGSGAVQRLD